MGQAQIQYFVMVFAIILLAMLKCVYDGNVGTFLLVFHSKLSSWEKTSKCSARSGAT